MHLASNFFVPRESVAELVFCEILQRLRFVTLRGGSQSGKSTLAVSIMLRYKAEFTFLKYFLFFCKCANFLQYKSGSRWIYSKLLGKVNDETEGSDPLIYQKYGGAHTGYILVTVKKGNSEPNKGAY